MCGTTVIQFAKKTGDYSVLSQADLSVIALAYGLDVQEKKAKEAAAEVRGEAPIELD